MLYPVDLTTRNDEDHYEVHSGSARAFAIEVEPGQSLQIRVVMTKESQQDWSLRCWVSNIVAGNPVIDLNPNEPIWHAHRDAQFYMTVYDEALPRPTTQHMELPPGSYFLNVLNLTNAPNSFFLSLT